MLLFWIQTGLVSQAKCPLNCSMITARFLQGGIVSIGKLLFLPWGCKHIMLLMVLWDVKKRNQQNYPMPSLAFMLGSNGKRFSVHSRQSLGAASLKDGWLEIMLDRRLLRDDGRGLGQGVMDNRPMNVIFHILFESNISSTSDPVSNPLPLSPSLLSHCVGAHLNYPLHAFVAKIPHELSVQPPPRSFSPLAAPLPCDLHIVNFKVPRPSKYSQQPIEDYRFVLILQRRHWDTSYCRKGRSQCTSVANEPLNIFNMFKGA
ncbi:ALPHA-MANNOSIDASE 2X [Salix purpurea]|uniref:ALPHA-MANNOSIDASE 2X n=1 Tax=Salix purpurea TaxID=77065 RepID=A0A9Q0VSP3_SALPP|nr:ALPHA-MANNOSIDASE 2X [Salix purpurea]